MTKSKITAVLGPTNTGKTHLAIETMLSFETGNDWFSIEIVSKRSLRQSNKENWFR